MLIRFAAKNFYCFREWAEIDLAFTKKTPIEVSQGEVVAKAICLKGANAAGKTNGIKIMSFLSAFVAHSFQTKPEELIPIEPFYDSTDPIEFSVEFTADDTEYTYELSLTKKEILSEKIYRKRQKKVLVFHRQGIKVKTNTLATKFEIGLRPNASVVSTANQHQEHRAAFLPLYQYFAQVQSNVKYSGFQYDLLHYSDVSSFYHKNPDYLDFTSQYLKRFDTGIESVEIIESKNEKGEPIHFPIFVHRQAEPRRTLLIFDESSGTKSLYNLLALYKITLDQGGILLLDEFDINLHTDILPHLVRLFENSETNPKKAQLLFVTQNSEIMDYMTKHRTYLFNKEENESYCYRLDELDHNLVRSDRPVSPLYRAGRIGGVPRL